MEVHHKLSLRCMQTATGVTRVLQIPIIVMLMLMHSMILIHPYWYHRVQMLNDHHQCTILQKNFLPYKKKIATDFFQYLGRAWYISP